MKSTGGIAVYIDAIPGKVIGLRTVNGRSGEHALRAAHRRDQRGTTVGTANSDQVAHNVYWPSAATKARHSLTSPRRGKKSFEFDDRCRATPLQHAR
jgi:hypothetical protein